MIRNLQTTMDIIEKNKPIIEYVDNLLDLFPNSFINDSNEFIAVPKTNLYFSLNNCNTLLDVKCKVLEWFSRDASKSQPFRNHLRNEKYQDDIREKINNFLGTNFSRNDMKSIYTELGNNTNRNLCMKFINNNYNIGMLKENN